MKRKSFIWSRNWKKASWTARSACRNSSCAIVDQTLETLSQRIQSLKPYSEKTVSVDEVGNGSQGTGSGGEELIVDGEIGPYDYNGLTGMMDS